MPTIPSNTYRELLSRLGVAQKRFLLSVKLPIRAGKPFRAWVRMAHFGCRIARSEIIWEREFAFGRAVERHRSITARFIQTEEVVFMPTVVRWRLETLQSP